MAEARFWDTTVTVTAGETQWRAKGERLLFAGWLQVYGKLEDLAKELPKLAVDEVLSLKELTKEQKFTQPPARYSEASLVKELEEKGIGRPSTYAAIISTLLTREYIQNIEKRLVPTDLGFIVSDLLSEHFQSLMDVHFTAGMEESLDKIAEGDADWVALLRTFTDDFYPTLDKAKTEMALVKTGLETGIECGECGKEMVIKFGKAGPFLACSGYPDCKNTSNFTRDEKGNIEIVEKVKPEHAGIGRKCPECEAELVEKKARTGSRFIACSAYPDCRYTEPFTTGVACPSEGCDGQMVEKSSKRGKLFYACDQYPKCSYALWNWPVTGPCPECSFPILERKMTKAKGPHLACPKKECRYILPLEEEETVD
jgi:DNA topoisomerase-1